MATVSGSLLLKSGVLRFVMEGERHGVTEELRAFSPDAAQPLGVVGDAETEKAGETGIKTDPLKASGKSGEQVDGAKDALISILRNELKQQKGPRSSIYVLNIFPFLSFPFLSFPLVTTEYHTLSLILS